jgi:hypothetical protein
LVNKRRTEAGEFSLARLFKTSTMGYLNRDIVPIGERKQWAYCTSCSVDNNQFYA